VGEWLRIEPEYVKVLSQLGLDSLEALLAGPGTRVRHSLHTNTYRLELPPGPSGSLWTRTEAEPPVQGPTSAAGASSGRPPARCGREAELPAKALYVKTYREAWPNLKYLFRRSRALREWRVLRGLRRRGISAARPVVVGERRRSRALLDAVVVTEEVPASIDLERFSPEFSGRPRTPDWRRQKRMYVEALAHFTRAMHDAGYVSRDFHWRNILIAETERGPHFAIIDNPRGLLLPCAALARVLGVGDLAALDRGASACLRRTDRLRFLRAYAGRPLRECRGLIQRIDRRRKPQVWRGEGSSASRPHRAGGRPLLAPAAEVCPATKVPPPARVPREPEAPRPAVESWRLVREGRCWAAFREGGGETPARPEMLTPEGLLHARAENSGGRFERWERRSFLHLYPVYGPCGRHWQNLGALEGLGLTVPRWLAFAQERAWGLPRREVLVLAALDDVEPVERWLERLRAQRVPAERARRALAEALGREVARAHAGGFCWKRFTLQGLGVRSLAAGAGARIGLAGTRTDAGEAPALEPVFLNVEAGVRRRRLSWRERAGDLVSLAACFSGQLAGGRLSAGAGGAEMLSFFRGYLGHKLTSVDKARVREVVGRYLKVERRSRQALLESRPRAAGKA